MTIEQELEQLQSDIEKLSAEDQVFLSKMRDLSAYIDRENVILSRARLSAHNKKLEDELKAEQAKEETEVVVVTKSGTRKEMHKTTKG